MMGYSDWWLMLITGGGFGFWYLYDLFSIISGNMNPFLGSSQIYSIEPVAGATSYTWDLPVAWTGSSNTVSITTTVVSGSGNISVFANNTCGSGIVKTLGIAITPAIDFELPDISVYPNPFHHYLFIRNSDKVERVILIYLTGQIVIDIKNPDSFIETSTLLNGMYVINLYSGTCLVESIKLIKK